MSPIATRALSGSWAQSFRHHSTRPQPVGAVGRAPGQLLERRAVVARQLRPLLLQPALELRRVRDMEPVEEGTGVLRGGLLQSVRVEGGREQGHVAGDEVGIETEVLRPQEHLIRAQLLAESIQGLVEPLPGPLIAGLGLEHREQAVPGDALVARGRKQGEQSQAARLGRRAAEPLPVALHVQPAERVEP